MEKTFYDIKYKIVKENGNYQLYYLCKNLDSYFLIATLKNDIKILDIKKVINKCWNLKKYNVKLEFKF